MRKLILHIGYPKTGTTTLQAFLARNGAALTARGVIYPSAGLVHEAHYGVNFALGLALHDRPEGFQVSGTIPADIAAEADASGVDTVVLSSEYFITAKPAAIRRVREFFADFEVRIVCYLRRHDDALESAYAQAVKTVVDPPWHDSIQGFLLHNAGLGTVSYEYLGVLRQWAGVFGAGNIIVRPYEAAQNVPDLPGDFLRAIGVEDGPDFVRPPSANRSIGPLVAAAIRMVRRGGLEDGLKRKVVGRLIQRAGREREGDRFLTPVEREAIVRRYEWMYPMIASEFMGRGDGVLFTAGRPEAQGGATAVAYSAEQVFETVLRAVVQ